MTLTQEITLDIYDPPYFEYVQAKQADNISRVLIITLTANGDTLKPSAGTDTAVLRALKPDGTSVVDPAAVGDDGKVTVALTDQVLACPGRVEADVSIIRGDVVLSSATMYIEVARAPISGKQIESADEFLVMVQAARDARAAAEEARRAASDAAETAGSAAGRADTAAGRANDAAKLIEGMTVSASKVAAGGTPTAKLTKDSGHYALALGLVTGDKGDTGPQGAKGDTGPTGAQGPKGDQGPVGPAGPAGPTGPTGPQGPAGANGVSPTVTTSKSGKVTTITIKDAAGEKKVTINDGADGATGSTGPTGPQGPAGPSSISTSTGSSVNGLLKGANGKVAAAVAGKDYVLPSGDITGSSGSCTGNAATATKVGHSLKFTGGSNVTFDGSSNQSVTIPTALPANGGHAATADRLKARPVVYTVSGRVFSSMATSYGTGYATVILHSNGFAEIHFGCVMDTAGSLATTQWGLANVLISGSDGRPLITPISGGSVDLFINNTYDPNYTGFGMTSMPSVAAGVSFWVPSRVYDAAGSIGPWTENIVAAGMRFNGTVFGTFDPAQMPAAAASVQGQLYRQAGVDLQNAQLKSMDIRDVGLTEYREA